MLIIPEKTGEKQENIRNEKGQFIPGVSGNPIGRPIGAKNNKLVEKIKLAIIKKLKQEGVEVEDAEMEVALAIADKILAGDINLLKEYWQQRDGKPKQPLTGSDEDDSPIIIKQVVYGSNHTSPIRPATLPDSDTPSDPKSEIQ